MPIHKGYPCQKPSAINLGEIELMCHGPGSLKRMNPDAASENHVEITEARIEKIPDTTQPEILAEQNLEIIQKPRKKKT